MLEFIPHDALPALISATADPNPDVRAGVAAVLTVFGPKPDIVIALTSMLDLADATSRKAALEAIAILAKYDESLVRYVDALLNDGDGTVREAAIDAIDALHLCDAHTTELLSLLSDESPLVRAAAAKALGNISNDNPDILPELRKLLDDEDESARAYAAFSSIKLGGRSDDLISILIDAARSDDYRLSLEAGNLGRVFTAENTGFIPELIGLLTDKSYHNYSAPDLARNSLCRIGTASITPLMDAIKSQPPDNRSELYEALRTCGPLALEVLPDLLKFFETGEENEKRDIVRVVIAIGPKPGVAEALMAIIESSETLIATEAVNGLRNLGPEAVPFLIELLSHNNMEIRSKAAWALAYMKPEPTEAVPYLVEALSDRELSVRTQALAGLGNIAKGDTAVIDILLTLLTDTESQMRSGAASALGKLYNGNSEIVKGLIAALDDKRSDYVRTSAARALSEIGSDAADAIPALIDILNDEADGARETVIDALPKISSSEAVVRVLLPIAVNESDQQQRHAVMALGAMGSDAASAVHGLEEAMISDDGGLDLDITTALAAIDPEGMHGADELKALRDGDVAWLRIRAAEILYHIGVERDIAIDTLLEMVNDPQVWARSGVIRAFFDIEPEPRIIDTLIRALDDFELDNASTAAIVLGYYGDAALEAVPGVIRLLDAPVGVDLDRIIRAVAEFGPAASDALPRLRDIAEYDLDASTREAAWEAIAKIEGTCENEE